MVVSMYRERMTYAGLFDAPQVYGRVSNACTDALDDLCDSIVIDVVRGDELEADGSVVFEVSRTLDDHRIAQLARVDRFVVSASIATHTELAADTSMDARVGHEPLLLGEIEERPVCDAGLL